MHYLFTVHTSRMRSLKYAVASMHVCTGMQHETIRSNFTSVNSMSSIRKFLVVNLCQLMSDAIVCNQCVHLEFVSTSFMYTYVYIIDMYIYFFYVYICIYYVHLMSIGQLAAGPGHRPGGASRHFRHLGRR